MTTEAILCIAWGDEHVRSASEVFDSKYLNGLDRYLVTDMKSDTSSLQATEVCRVQFELDGLLRKAELVKHLPIGYSSVLLLDTDVRVLQDISMGFEAAKLHGLAMAPAPHYSLSDFFGFNRVMNAVDVRAASQLQYNTGAVFLSPSTQVLQVLQCWYDLAHQYGHMLVNDQPFLSLACELMHFNPYTLSPSYNTRGFGNAISGPVRVWHSNYPVPKGLNSYRQTWPPRRVKKGRVKRPSRLPPLWRSFRRRLVSSLRNLSS